MLPPTQTTLRGKMLRDAVRAAYKILLPKANKVNRAYSNQSDMCCAQLSNDSMFGHEVKANQKSAKRGHVAQVKLMRCYPRVFNRRSRDINPF